MQISRTSLSKNALFGIISWVLPLGLSLTATPLILKKMGAAEYGVYALVLGFLGYSFAFGIGRSVTKYIAEYRSTGEFEKISEVLTVVLILNAVIGITAVAVFCGGADWFIGDLLAVAAEYRQAAVESFYLAGFVISAALIGQIFAAVLQAFHRFDIYSIITVLSTSISTLGNIIIVYGGGSIRGLMIWNLISTVLISVVFWYHSAKLLKGVKITLRFSRGVLTAILKFNSAIIIMQIFGNLLLLFERSWIAAKFGTEALTYYVIPMNLSFLIHLFINSFIVVIFPVASEVKLLKTDEKLLAIYRKATKLSVAATVFFALTMIVCRTSILTNYVSADFAEHAGQILIFHTLTFSIVAVGAIFWQIIDGSGAPHITALLAFGWFSISVPLMVVFSDSYSVESLAVARFIGVLIFVPMIFYVEKRVFGIVLKLFWTKMLLIAAAAAAAAAACEYAVNSYTGGGWQSLFLSVGAGGSVYSIILVCAGYFDKEEIKRFAELAGRLKLK